MKNMDNTPERAALIGQMVEIVRRDAPWAWGVNPRQFLLQHSWVHNTKPNHMANNTMKYRRLDAPQRAQSRMAWNRPVLWPMVLVLGVLVAGAVPAVAAYRKREREVRR